MVEAPTFRNLATLERASASGSPGGGLRQPTAASPRPTGASWGARQGVTFLGVALVALSLVGLALLLVFKPAKPQDVIPSTNVDSMSPGVAWRAWADVERGLQQPVTLETAIPMHELAIDRGNWQKILYVVEAITGVGVMLTLVGLLLGALNSKQRRAPAS